jgi:hypothetical protein
LENYHSLKNSLQGAPLSRGNGNPGNSFDFAAASVAPAPLKYLPSFDSTYNDVLLDDSPQQANNKFYSDRVTLLHDNEISPRKKNNKPTKSSSSSSFEKKPASNPNSSGEIHLFSSSGAHNNNDTNRKRSFYSDSNLQELPEGMNPDFFLEENKRRKLEEDIDSVARMRKFLENSSLILFL